MVFIYDRPVSDAANIRDECQRDLGLLKQFLGWVERDVSQFNTTIEEK